MDHGLTIGRNSNLTFNSPTKNNLYQKKREELFSTEKPIENDDIKNRLRTLNKADHYYKIRGSFLIEKLVKNESTKNALLELCDEQNYVGELTNFILKLHKFRNEFNSMERFTQLAISKRHNSTLEIVNSIADEKLEALSNPSAFYLEYEYESEAVALKISNIEKADHENNLKYFLYHIENIKGDFKTSVGLKNKTYKKMDTGLNHTLTITKLNENNFRLITHGNQKKFLLGAFKQVKNAFLNTFNTETKIAKYSAMVEAHPQYVSEFRDNKESRLLKKALVLALDKFVREALEDKALNSDPEFPEVIHIVKDENVQFVTPFINLEGKKIVHETYLYPNKGLSLGDLNKFSNEAQNKILLNFADKIIKNGEIVFDLKRANILIFYKNPFNFDSRKVIGSEELASSIYLNSIDFTSQIFTFINPANYQEYVLKIEHEYFKNELYKTYQKDIMAKKLTTFSFCIAAIQLKYQDTFSYDFCHNKWELKNESSNIGRFIEEAFSSSKRSNEEDFIQFKLQKWNTFEKGFKETVVNKKFGKEQATALVYLKLLYLTYNNEILDMIDLKIQLETELNNLETMKFT